MRVQTFVGKVTFEALQQMDEHINQWMATHNIEPKKVTQTFGYDKPREACAEEPVIITSVWY